MRSRSVLRIHTIIDDIKINGKLTNGEDLADLGGTLLAYLAWKEDTKDQKLESLDELTPEQRFFVAYGQSWCTNERDENKRLRATVDPHSPEKLSGQWRSLEHDGYFVPHSTASRGSRWCGRTPAGCGSSGSVERTLLSLFLTLIPESGNRAQTAFEIKHEIKINQDQNQDQRQRTRVSALHTLAALEGVPSLPVDEALRPSPIRKRSFLIHQGGKWRWRSAGPL